MKLRYLGYIYENSEKLSPDRVALLLVMSPYLQADPDLLLPQLYKLRCLKMLLNKPQNLDKNETRKVGFLAILLAKEPPKVLLLTLEVVIDHINDSPTYHESLAIPYIDTYLPH